MRKTIVVSIILGVGIVAVIVASDRDILLRPDHRPMQHFQRIATDALEFEVELAVGGDLEATVVPKMALPDGTVQWSLVAVTSTYVGQRRLEALLVRLRARLRTWHELGYPVDPSESLVVEQDARVSPT